MSRDTPLPSYMPDHWKNLPHLQYKRNSHEWSAACPSCGTSGHSSYSGKPDRFVIFDKEDGKDARGWCRQCGYFEWANQNNNNRASPEEIARMEQARAQQEEREKLQLKQKLDSFMAEKLWQFFHDEMNERERWLWTRAGIPDPYQDLWSLGYAKHYPSKKFDSPALTIPHFNVGWTASNMQYRLLSPPKPGDKYRFTQGLPHSLWLPEPDKDLTGVCILCEGMKKAAVTFIRVVVEPNNQQFKVVSVPSKRPAKALYSNFSNFEKVYIVLDPDAYTWTKNSDGSPNRPAVYDMVEQINGPSINVVTLPTKADDFFIKYDGSSKDFIEFLNQSREVKQQSNETQIKTKNRTREVARASTQILRPVPIAASAEFC